MPNVPTHKHTKNQLNNERSIYTFIFGPIITTNQIHDKKMCWKMLKWPQRFRPFLSWSRRICTILQQYLIENQIYHSGVVILLTPQP
jgi:hypothetical protein